VQFTDRVVFIVGASSGIGRAVAVRLAWEGAILAVGARRADRLEALVAELRGIGASALAVPFDAADEAASEAAVETVISAFGRIDAVLLNAGGAPALDLRELSAAEVKGWFASNVDVTVNVLMPVLARMRAAGGGLVVHTNSLAGFAGIPLQAPYSAAKAATRMLIDAARIEFADDRIRFVTVYPGFVATDRTQGDGMPAPREISEDRAADEVVSAMRRERWDAAFPASTAALVRLLRILPKRVGAWYLRRELRAARAAADGAVENSNH
jgi:NADP-dependent 3-hydroxy acid dehydrogenase YdfG